MGAGVHASPPRASVKQVPLDSFPSPQRDEDDAEEAAAEARELLTSWMRIDEQANRIREEKTRDAAVQERVVADRRSDGVRKTKHTRRPLPFEHTLRHDDAFTSSDENRANALQRAGTHDDAEESFIPKRSRASELNEKRAEAEAQAILTLAERMVLAPLKTPSSPSRSGTVSAEERALRIKNQTQLRGRKGDPIMMMEARQASIRAKREERRARQQENDRAQRRMTVEEKRAAKAAREKREKQRAREEARARRQAEKNVNQEAKTAMA